MDEEDHGRGGGGRRISKRARRDKSLVVKFDEAARKEFLTGFRKRKNKRRKIAEEKKTANERQKRLFERKERRLTRKKALGLIDEENPGDGEEHEAGEEESGGDLPEKTVVYENDRTRTVVKITDPPPPDAVLIKPAATKNKALKLKKRPKRPFVTTEYASSPNSLRRSSGPRRAAASTSTFR